MKTLGLGMIVGPGDGVLFKRCMASLTGHCFNQIVAVVTTSNQEDIDFCKSTGVEVIQREWTSARYPYGDFAGARNEALRALHTDYAMWLDCDDVFINSTRARWAKLSAALQNGPDVGRMQYVLRCDANGAPANVIKRERIWRIKSGLRWRYPIHEQLLDDATNIKIVNFNGMAVYHQPNKDEQSSLGRNLQILEHEFNRAKFNRDRHISFYYARDLFAAGKKEAAISIARSILSDFTSSDRGDIRLLYETCDLLSRFYLYEDIGAGSNLKKSTAPLAENYARVAATVFTNNAEPIVHCGDSLLARGNTSGAESFYRHALSKRFGSDGIQDADYYSFIPAVRLSAILKERGELEEALMFNKKVLDIDPKNKQALRDKKDIVCDLLKEVL